jgi:hypothetical protein
LDEQQRADLVEVLKAPLFDSGMNLIPSSLRPGGTSRGCATCGTRLRLAVDTYKLFMPLPAGGISVRLPAPYFRWQLYSTALTGGSALRRASVRPHPIQQMMASPAFAAAPK